MENLTVQIAPKQAYEKYKNVWDNLQQILKIKIRPAGESPEKENKCDETHYTLQFGGKENCPNNKHTIILEDNLNSIDPILIKNTFVDGNQLYELVKTIRTLQQNRTKSLACIIIDDPTFYGNRYGNIHYELLVNACKKYGVKCCIAVVPIDLWFRNRKMIEFLHKNGEYISLCMHGVFHLRDDLNRHWDVDTCVEYLNYGIKRIRKFEDKTGLKIAKLIVPPHEKLSKNMFEALSKTEISGVITAGNVNGYSQEIRKNDYIAGMQQIYHSDWNIPVILRDSLKLCATNSKNNVKERMHLRSLLHQPILFESHHNDFENTEKVIKNISLFVKELGAKWATIDEIEGFVTKNVLSNKVTYDSGQVCKQITISMIGAAFTRRVLCMTRDWLKSKYNSKKSV